MIYGAVFKVMRQMMTGWQTVSLEPDLDFLTLAQVAEKMHLHPKTLRRQVINMMVKNPALTVTRVGRSILFTRAQLDELTKALEWRSPVADLMVRRSTIRHIPRPLQSAQERLSERLKQRKQADKEERVTRRKAAIAAVTKQNR